MLMNIFLFIISSLLLHPIHISKCQMEVNPDSKHLEIALHVYIDDLQEVIEKAGNPPLFLATEKEIKSANQLIHKYLSDHLIIMNGEEQIRFKWVGKEQSEDLLAFFCYLESEEIDLEKELNIEFSVLHDLYDDQNNLLNIIMPNGDEEYFICQKSNAIAKIK